MTKKLEIQLDLGENYYEPRGFADAAVYADELGFRTAWFGDHFVPWFHSGKKSAFVWPVLAVALEKSEHIRVGPLVTTPMGARYHPALVAQASATLDNMYPGRFLLGVGTGEALNETPFWNGRWPDWEERMERLTEGIRLIRKLWTSRKPFSFDGEFFGAGFYYLYTKSATAIPIYFSAIGRKAAYNAGLYADHLVTISPRNSVQKLREEIIPSFKKGCEGSKEKKRGGIVIYITYSFQSPENMIRESSKTLGWVLKDSWSIANPVEVEKAGKNVTADDLRRTYNICENWRDVIGVLDEYVELGAEAVVFGTDARKRAIREIAENVLSVF